MGERQRVMIARALSTEPRLLLADEPTGSLDTQRGREVLELLRELCRERGVAVVLVSHDPMAADYADRVFALRDGRLSDLRDRSGLRHDGRRRRLAGEAGERPAPLPRAPARALGAGVPGDRGDRRRGRAAVRLAGLELEPAELGGPALARDRRQRDAAARRARPATASRRARSRACARSPACASRRRCWKRARTRSARAGSESVELVGADASLSKLGGALVRHTALTPFGGIGAVVLPAPLARTIGVSKFGQEVTFQLAGHTAAGAALRTAPRKPDRAVDREPGRDRAAVLRAGNDGSAVRA